MIKVNFYATLRYIAGGKTIEIDVNQGATAKEILDAILLRFPAMKKELMNEDGRLFGHVHFFINGRDVQFTENDLETHIQAGDVINVFPAVGGG
jgi:molybdopterin synthase sulfur carrier subunit